VNPCYRNNLRSIAARAGLLWRSPSDEGWPPEVVLGPSSRVEIAVSRVRTSSPDEGGALFVLVFAFDPALRFTGVRFAEAFFLAAFRRVVAFFRVDLAAFFLAGFLAVLRVVRFFEAFFLAAFFEAFFFTLFLADFFLAAFFEAFFLVFLAVLREDFFAAFRVFLRAAIDQFSRRQGQSRASVADQRSDG
jgi:hypothetical protein